MAEDKNVFDAYCGCLMLELKEMGYLKNDWNWNVYAKERCFKFVLSGADNETFAYPIVKYSKKNNSITIIDALTNEEKVYDFSPENRNVKSFKKFAISFIEELKEKES